MAYVGYEEKSKTPVIINDRENYSFEKFSKPNVFDKNVSTIALSSLSKIVYIFSLSGKKSQVMGDIMEKSDNIPNLLNFFDIKRDKKTESTMNQFEVFKNSLCSILRNATENLKEAALEFLTLCAGSQTLFMLAFIDSNKLILNKKIQFWDNFKDIPSTPNNRLLAKYAIFVSILLNNESLKKKIMNDSAYGDQMISLLLKCNNKFMQEYRNVRDMHEFQIDNLSDLETDVDDYCLNNTAITAVTNIYTKLILSSTPKSPFTYYKLLNDFIKTTISIPNEFECVKIDRATGPKLSQMLTHHKMISKPNIDFGQ